LFQDAQRFFIMGKICTVNGIRSKGEGSTDLLGQELRNLSYEVLDINQEIRHTWNVRDKGTVKRDVEKILDLSSDGDIMAGHSYGGYKIAEAMKKRNYKAVFLFRPAMDRDYGFIHRETKIYCIYSKKDVTIWFGSTLLFHKFGAAGAKGFRDDLVTNIKSKGGWGHSSDFNPLKQRQYWANYIARLYPNEI